MFVLGIDLNFHFLVGLVVQIDHDLDHGDPREIMQELFRFFLDLFLMRLVQMPMSGDDFDLHKCLPPMFMLACSLDFTANEQFQCARPHKPG